MRKTWCVPTMLALVAVGASACRDGRSPFAGASPWALDPSVLEAGGGHPLL